jgi:hypothetical protein
MLSQSWSFACAMSLAAGCADMIARSNRTLRCLLLLACTLLPLSVFKGCPAAGFALPGASLSQSWRFACAMSLAAGCADMIARSNRTLRCSLVLAYTSLPLSVFEDCPAAGFALPGASLSQSWRFACAMSLAAGCADMHFRVTFAASAVTARALGAGVDNVRNSALAYVRECFDSGRSPL